MKQVRVISPILFVLLTVVSFQMALAVPPSSTLAAAPANLEMISSEDFLCKLSRVNPAELPGSDPAPIQATGAICGGCSISECVNKAEGSRCWDRADGGWAWCLAPTVATCGSDTRPFCDCLQEYP